MKRANRVKKHRNFKELLQEIYDNAEKYAVGNEVCFKQLLLDSGYINISPSDLPFSKEERQKIKDGMFIRITKGRLSKGRYYTKNVNGKQQPPDYLVIEDGIVYPVELKGANKGTIVHNGNLPNKRSWIYLWFITSESKEEVIMFAAASDPDFCDVCDEIVEDGIKARKEEEKLKKNRLSDPRNRLGLYYSGRTRYMAKFDPFSVFDGSETFKDVIKYIEERESGYVSVGTNKELSKSVKPGVQEEVGPILH